MDRRRFLQGATLGMAGVTLSAPPLAPAEPERRSPPDVSLAISPSVSDREVEGFTPLCEFEMDGQEWRVFEDLRSVHGSIAYLSSSGGLVLKRSAEATYPEAGVPYLGLDIHEIGLADHDLLAERLLREGDPDLEEVRKAAPPLQSSESSRGAWGRWPWNTFVGTKQCSDTMPVYFSGSTRTYHPIQYFPDMDEPLARRRLEGLIGGWMPAARKVLPVTETNYYETIVFGDVLATDEFIVQTWHRTTQIKNGKPVKSVYGYSYPAFSPARQDPQPEEFYRGLLLFAAYWQQLLHDFPKAELPDPVWIDMSRHAFARDLVVRPRGVYPKYGAVDRDYYGSEYDGFQDTFSSATYANLEWGRFEMAKQVIDNYFTQFVDDRGMVNMRGPETGQFGLTLSLLARYYAYTGDSALLLRYQNKIEATADLLVAMHEKSLSLPPSNPGHGLIHGWNESDSCLMERPATWWQPYFANSAFAARGLRDISRTWTELGRTATRPLLESQAALWNQHSQTLQNATIASIRKNVRHDMTPPYIGPLPGADLTFRESVTKEHPSRQQWPHRAYCELLQADILPPDLANIVIDCMRAYGATTLGVVANVGRPNPHDRDILGFISYGYAQMLLRLDRIEEYLLFLYSHRFHDHTPGSWTAGEVADIVGGSAIFCMPAQQTIPLLVRWMLLLEDSDADNLYVAKALPRDWLLSGKPVQLERAPTRWGPVSLHMVANGARDQVQASLQFFGRKLPRIVEVKFRLPRGRSVSHVLVNGEAARMQGLESDTVSIRTNGRRRLALTAAC